MPIFDSTILNNFLASWGQEKKDNFGDISEFFCSPV